MRKLLLITVLLGLSLVPAGSTCYDDCTSCMNDAIEVGWQARGECMAGGGSDPHCSRVQHEAECAFLECFCPQCPIYQLMCNRS